jgi:hypothetical protein
LQTPAVPSPLVFDRHDVISPAEQAVVAHLPC